MVGGGTVGLHLANELTKRGREVIVVEAGSVHLGNFSPDSFRSDGLKHEGIRTGRSRSLGGTSNLWGGQLVEYQPVDFRGRDWLARSRWPVTYEQIQPYYQKTYDALGIPRDLQDDALVWRDISKTKPALDSGLEVFLTRWLKVPSIAVMLAKKIETSPALQVLMGHTAVGFDYAGDQVTGVKLRDPQGNCVVLSGAVFVLAVGTIETSRLLLHSAAEDPLCPWRRNPHLGAWFMDHLGGRIGRVYAQSPRKFFDVFCTIAVRMFKFAPKIRMKNEVLEREKVLSVQAMIDFESSISENLVYLKQFLKAAIFSRQVKGIADLGRNVIACTRYLVPLMWRFVFDHRIFVPSDSKISMLVQAEQAPCPESRITIDSSHRDVHGLPQVVLNWQLAGGELESIREFALRVQQAVAGAGLGRLEIDEQLLRGDPRFLETLRDTTHQAGGAVMGFSAEDGVVDANLQVFGTANLYVTGAAVFRTVSNANTTFTALTFTTRLAEYIAVADSPVAKAPGGE